MEYLESAISNMLIEFDNEVIDADSFVDDIELKPESECLDCDETDDDDPYIELETYSDLEEDSAEKDEDDDYYYDDGTEFEKNDYCEDCTEKDWELYNSLYEGVRSSNVKIKKKAKRAAYAGRAALGVAKKRSDPLLKKYKLYKFKTLKLKAKLMKKYSKRGMKIAKKKMR